MAAQAIGRAVLLRDRAAVAVAIGAGFFMLSDSLLAINKFATPLPMAQLWVLASYYVAQVLIARHPLAGVPGSKRQPRGAPVSLGLARGR